MAKEKNRMIDDYKVVNSMFVGVREFALCENLKAPTNSIIWFVKFVTTVCLSIMMMFT